MPAISPLPPSRITAMPVQYSMPTLKTSSVEVVIYRKESGRNVFLLLHCAPQERFAGSWRTAAGRISPNETTVAAVLRTVREEVGLAVVNLWSLDYAHTCFDAQSDSINIVPLLLAEVSEGKATLSPSYAEARWVMADQADELLRAADQREAIHRANESVVQAADHGASLHIALPQ